MSARTDLSPDGSDDANAITQQIRQTIQLCCLSGVSNIQTLHSLWMTFDPIFNDMTVRTTFQLLMDAEHSYFGMIDSGSKSPNKKLVCPKDAFLGLQDWLSDRGAVSSRPIFKSLSCLRNYAEFRLKMIELYETLPRVFRHDVLHEEGRGTRNSAHALVTGCMKLYNDTIRTQPALISLCKHIEYELKLVKLTVLSLRVIESNRVAVTVHFFLEIKKFLSEWVKYTENEVDLSSTVQENVHRLQDERVLNGASREVTLQVTAELNDLVVKYARQNPKDKAFSNLDYAQSLKTETPTKARGRIDGKFNYAVDTPKRKDVPRDRREERNGIQEFLIEKERPEREQFVIFIPPSETAGKNKRGSNTGAKLFEQAPQKGYAPGEPLTPSASPTRARRMERQLQCTFYRRLVHVIKHLYHSFLFLNSYSFSFGLAELYPKVEPWQFSVSPLLPKGSSDFDGTNSLRDDRMQPINTVMAIHQRVKGHFMLFVITADKFQIAPVLYTDDSQNSKEEDESSRPPPESPYQTVRPRSDSRVRICVDSSSPEIIKERRVSSSSPASRSGRMGSFESGRMGSFESGRMGPFESFSRFLDPWPAGDEEEVEDVVVDTQSRLPSSRIAFDWPWQHVAREREHSIGDVSITCMNGDFPERVPFKTETSFKEFGLGLRSQIIPLLTYPCDPKTCDPTSFHHRLSEPGLASQILTRIAVFISGHREALEAGRTASGMLMGGETNDDFLSCANVFGMFYVSWLNPKRDRRFELDFELIVKQLRPEAAWEEVAKYFAKGE